MHDLEYALPPLSSLCFMYVLLPAFPLMLAFLRLTNRMPHFIDVVVKVVPEGLADATPSGRIVIGGSTSTFRLDQFVNGKTSAVQRAFIC